MSSGITGLYQHYKGGLYTVYGIAIHTETKEEMVVYTTFLGEGTWVRPKEMFFGEVEGQPRFKKLSEEEAIELIHEKLNNDLAGEPK